MHPRTLQIIKDYPAGPDWVLEADAILIELVKSHAQQPDCAIAALRELCRRKSESAGELSVDLLDQPDADKWLKVEAFRSLPETHLVQGFEAVRTLVDRCQVEVLEMLAAAMNDLLRGEMADMLRYHDVVRKLGGGHYWGNGNGIQFAGSLTRDEYIQAERLMKDESIPAWSYILLMAIWALLAGVLTWLSHLLIPAVMMLLLGLILAGFAKSMHGNAVEWDCKPEYRMHLYGTISEDGIDTHCENSWRLSPWCEWSGWSASDDMLVALSPAGARILPVSLFSSWTDWEAARTLCAKHLPEQVNRITKGKNDD